MVQNWTVSFIADRNMKILRRKKDNMPLAVAYGTEGLKWATTISGRSLYFKSWFFKLSQIQEVFAKREMAHDVYEEHFVPRVHKSKHLNDAEYAITSKALRMLYTSR